MFLRDLSNPFYSKLPQKTPANSTPSKGSRKQRDGQFKILPVVNVLKLIGDLNEYGGIIS
jgi:hypothetical protein